MKQKSNIILWISILSFIGSCIAYFFLPDMIPVHFNETWEPDGYGAKEMIFFFGALPLGTIGLFKILPKIDPKKANYLKYTSSFTLMRNIMVLFMIGLNWFTVGISLNENWDHRRIIPIFMGTLFILIGNYLPKVKSNYFVEIKTPWALSNDKVWRKTHKFGGYLFVIYGVFSIISGLIVNKYIQKGLAISIIFFIIIMYVYSYVIYRKESKKETQGKDL